MKKVLFIICTLFIVSGCTSDPDAKYFEEQYIRSTVEKVAGWQLNHPKHQLCDWTNGAFYAGVFAAWETTRSADIYQALLDMGGKTGWQPCNTAANARANDMAICQTYIDLFRIEKRQEMIQPAIDTLNAFMQREYHPYGIHVQKWWWCDALFMEPPTIVKLGVTTGNKEFLVYNDLLFKQCYDLLYDEEEHLFARDIEYVIKGDGKDKLERNGQKIFWSRGDGWVLAGLARILEELPADYPERPFYERIFKEMSARLITIQQADGLWRCSLLDPEAYPGGEVSGSGFYCYGLAWGINNGLLDRKTFLPAVKKVWIALNGCLNEEGRLGWVQPIGDNPMKNFSADSWEVYGTGAFLLAGREIYLLSEK
ncbi:MAG: glycoside hydrolase family 88 protein [Tannerella sp.]|jgi:rhamnogalacturonyl hydrolase YesR|nr:glycoside hydrolase family 88 protein [Tannerella sp.]